MYCTQPECALTEVGRHPSLARHRHPPTILRTFRASPSHSHLPEIFRTSSSPNTHKLTHRQRTNHRKRCIASRKLRQAARALWLARSQVAFFLPPLDESGASPEAPCRRLWPILRTTTGLAGACWNARRASLLTWLKGRLIGEWKKKRVELTRGRGSRHGDTPVITGLNPHEPESLGLSASSQLNSTTIFSPLPGVCHNPTGPANYVSLPNNERNEMRTPRILTPDPESLPHEVDRRTRFRCSTGDCDQTFSRRGDLERHVNSRHAQQLSYACPAVGCFKGHSPTKFARSDKLADHLRAVHWHHDIRFRCDRRGCQDHGLMSLPELAAHYSLRYHESGNTINNASRKRRCPLWTCGKSFMFDNFITHLSGHSDDELESIFDLLQDAGYVVAGANSMSAEMSTTSRRLSIKVRCPVARCQAVCADHEHFAQHLIFSHLAQQGSAAHDHLSQWSHEVCGAAMLRNGAFFPWDLKSYAGFVSRACPACPFRSDDIIVGGNIAQIVEKYMAHQKSLFRPDEDVIAELEPYRVQLLRLCPAFYKHPLYNYLKSTTAAGGS